MKKFMIFYFFILILGLTLSFVLYLQLRTNRETITTENSHVKTTIGGQIYNLELASTNASRQKGLMNRSKLEDNGGMLFVFDGTGIYPFWMKNTLIPLDIIWINTEKKVVHIIENAQPCETTLEAICNSIIPLKPAMYVIELNAGEVKNLGLNVGDSVEFSLE